MPIIWHLKELIISVQCSVTLETGVRSLPSRLDGSPTVVFQVRLGLLTDVMFLDLSVSQVGTPLEILKVSLSVSVFMGNFC